MKARTLIFSLASILLLALSTCKKDPQPIMERFDLSREDLTVGTTSASIVGTYAYSGTIDEITVCVSEDGVHPATFVADINGKNFAVEMTGLQPATSYQYYYSVDYGFTKPFITETKFFSTLSELPTVRTVDVISIDSTTVRVNGETVSDGGVEITERGVCWNTYGNPNLEDETSAYGSGGLGEYSCRIGGLSPSTRYYVRAYAKNASGIGFGEVLMFQTDMDATLPSVTTEQVTNITQTSAMGCGNVLSEGSAAVTERGICWGTSHNPTISGSHANNGTGTGGFTVSMTDLTANTHYYVRAYAKNSVGVSYGDEVDFTTAQNISAPTVTTSQVTNITQTTATGGGNVTSDGGATVTERGICWGTSHNPTTSGSYANSGTGTGSFTVNMAGLTANTTYYVRAYAINSAGTSYGSEVSFTTLSGGGGTMPTGAINGLFTINANGDQVYFSQGNLQYQASTNTWRFAENQYDYVGDGNANISPTYNGWIDLFGWGTGNNPTNSSGNYGNYSSFHEWGDNSISNGGNQAGLWRTLTKDEWHYILKQRATPSGKRYVKAQVNGVNGVVVLPDNWSNSTYSLNNANDASAFTNYTDNTLTASQWIVLEQVGAIFLPAAGNRYQTSVGNFNTDGCYWSASYYDTFNAFGMTFAAANLISMYQSHRQNGYSVRLVSPAY